MPNYAARREIGSNFGAMLGAYFGQMAAKRSREQLGADVESLREIADKSLSTNEPMTPDDYANRLSKLYAHHGVRRDEGFQTDVGLFADKAGKRQSAAFAKQLYPDRPLYSESTPTGPLTQEDTAEINKYNQGQSRTRTLLSRFSPSQQFGYYTGQQNAEAAAKAKAEAESASWSKFFLNLNKPKPDEMLTLYGPNGATRRVPVEQGKEFIPPEGWTLLKPGAQSMNGATWDSSRGVLIYPDGRVETLESLPKKAATGRKPTTAETNLGLILDAISKGTMPEMPMDEIFIQAGVMKGKIPPGLREALGNVVYLSAFQEADLNGKIEIIKGIVDSFNPQKQAAPVDATQRLNLNPDASPGY